MDFKNRQQNIIYFRVSEKDEPVVLRENEVISFCMKCWRVSRDFWFLLEKIAFYVF